jgi:hypothetical protein
MYKDTFWFLVKKINDVIEEPTKWELYIDTTSDLEEYIMHNDIETQLELSGWLVYSTSMVDKNPSSDKNRINFVIRWNLHRKRPVPGPGVYHQTVKNPVAKQDKPWYKFW